MTRMEVLSAFLAIVWIAVNMFAILFPIFRFQIRIIGRGVVRLFLVSMFINSGFVIPLFILMGASSVQLACLVAGLLLLTVVGAVFVYKVGERIEKTRGDSIERTPLKMQDVGRTDKEDDK